MTDPHRDRLIAFALLGAAAQHHWWFDPTQNTDGLRPDGHEEPFATCPHPDCVLVRDVTLPAARFSDEFQIEPVEPGLIRITAKRTGQSFLHRVVAEAT